MQRLAMSPAESVGFAPWDLSQPLGIDAVMTDLRHARRAPRLRDERLDEVRIGRRTLEVAIERALLAEAQAPNPSDLDGWAGIATNATKARRTLAALIKSLDGRAVRNGQPTARDLAPIISQVWLLGAPSGVAGLPQSELEAAILLRSHEIAGELQRVAAQRRNEIARTRKGAPGDPVARAFLDPLAEGWLFLTGGSPSTNRTASPFLNFAEAAWSDWRGERRPGGFGAIVGGVARKVAQRAVNVMPHGPTWL
jgi:hypothetical protein